ncbi:hypothetical protein [Virgibacillus sp. JSM 102003]
MKTHIAKWYAKSSETDADIPQFSMWGNLHILTVQEGVDKCKKE